jgi:hypothetical protein
MTSLPFSFTPTALYDTDEYRQWANQHGWDLEARQISRGPNQIDFDHVAFPEFSVANHRVKRAMYDVFDIPSRHIVFVICRVKLPAVWCGMELPPSVLALHRPGRTYRLDSRPAGTPTSSLSPKR